MGQLCDGVLYLVSCVCVAWVGCGGEWDRVISDQMESEKKHWGGKKGTYGAAGTAGLGRAVGGGSALGAAGSVHVGFNLGVECLLLWGVETLVWWKAVCVYWCEGEEREGGRRGGLGQDTYLQV